MQISAWPTAGAQQELMDQSADCMEQEDYK